MEKILRRCSKTVPRHGTNGLNSDASTFYNMKLRKRFSFFEVGLVEIPISRLLSLPHQALALLMFLALGTVHTAHAEQVHISILSPSSESHDTLSKQLLAGAEYALRDAADARLEVVDVDFSDEREVSEVFDYLAEDGTDVVIGGLTPESATQIFLVAMNRKIPTILLSAPTLWMSELRQQSVIQLGFSNPAIYRLGLKQWIEQEDIAYAQVIYRGDSEPSFSLGAKITPYIFDNLFVDRDVSYKLTDIAPFTRGSAGYIDYLGIADDHSGIVLAGLSDERDGVLDTLNTMIPNILYNDASIFIADPQSALENVSSVANRTSLPSYSASQFWLTPATNSLHRDFIDNLEEHTDEWYGKLPWLNRNFALSAAAKAHDGVKVAVSAVNSIGSGWDPNEISWSSVLVDPVQGISGVLNLVSPYVIAGPVYFVGVQPNGDAKTAIIDLP